MNPEVLKLILQLFQLMMNKTVKQGLTQGFVTVDDASLGDNEDIKQKLADAMGCDVEDLDFIEDGSISA